MVRVVAVPLLTVEHGDVTSTASSETPELVKLKSTPPAAGDAMLKGRS